MCPPGDVGAGVRVGSTVVVGIGVAVGVGSTVVVSIGVAVGVGSMVVVGVGLAVDEALQAANDGSKINIATVMADAFRAFNI